MAKRKLRKRVRRLERRLAALEHVDAGIDVSGEPLDVHAIAARIVELHSAGGWDGEDWNPARGYL